MFLTNYKKVFFLFREILYQWLVSFFVQTIGSRYKRKMSSAVFVEKDKSSFVQRRSDIGVYTVLNGFMPSSGILYNRIIWRLQGGIHHVQIRPMYTQAIVGECYAHTVCALCARVFTRKFTPTYIHILIHKWLWYWWRDLKKFIKSEQYG